MELDQLKSTWQSLDRRLAQHNRIQLQLLRDGKLEKIRSSLHPLFRGQVAQILFGLPFILLAALLWHQAGRLPSPLPASTLAAGILVQAYGIAVVVLAGCTLGMIRSIDYSAPVLEIQKQLAGLRRFYILNGMISGLCWWFLWVPLLMVLTGLGGVELLAREPLLVWSGLGVGAAGLAATAWFHRWSRSPRRPRLARAVENSVTGGSLRRARQFIDELERFEQE